jgi:hypothetical protein
MDDTGPRDTGPGFPDNRKEFEGKMRNCSGLWRAEGDSAGDNQRRIDNGGDEKRV